ncbi:MAG: GNAT family N-acetyltransferase [Pirellulales bacterium]|nr:GNAT family N-acetyltransferase [Pirellulales bacterium]
MRAKLHPSDEWLRMADVVEITDLAELDHYRMAWNALLPATPRASFFHTFDWFAAQWRHAAGPDRRFRVLAIRSAGSIVGIVPLCVQTERYRLGRVRVLTYPLADWGMWYGPIGPNQAASMRLAMQHVRNAPRDWDLLELRWLDAAPCDRSGAVASLLAVGMPARMSRYQSTSVVEFKPSWDEYLAGRSSKWRHELRRQLRVVDELGDVEFVRHRPAGAVRGDADPRWDLFDDCQRVAAASWQGRSNSGNTISHGDVREFLRESHAAAARLGMLDVALLKVDGVPAAFAYNYFYDGHVVGLRIGYDKSVSDRGLGRALLAHVIRDSCRRGDKEIDMGPGDYDFKRRFRTRVETSARVVHYPPLAMRSLGVRLTRWLKTQPFVQDGGKQPAVGEPSVV